MPYLMYDRSCRILAPSTLIISIRVAPRITKLALLAQTRCPFAKVKRMDHANSTVEEVTNVDRTTQYVRCTLQKSMGEVASCVANNAVKVDWLSQIQSYTGASSCPDSSHYLVTLGTNILREVLGTLFSVLLWPKMAQAAKSRFTFLQRGRKGRLEAAELREFQQLPKDYEHGRLSKAIPETYPWTLEKRYTLKATRLLQSIGKEVLTAYLSVLVLTNAGYVGTSTFHEEISFYLVRPRSAPFLGLLGLFEPWSQPGLAVLIVDGMLSFVAGTNVAFNYWALVNHPPSNPAAPASELKTLAVGAIMTCIPAFAVLVITFLVSMGMASDNDDKGRRKNKDDSSASFIAGLCIWSLWLLAIALFICILPLVAIVEMIAAVVLTIRRKLKKRKIKAAGNDDDAEDLDMWEKAMRRSRWMEPLTTESGKFRVLYAVFILSSFVINIGNWIFFASYLKLEGEMYCPTEVSSVMTMWILVPLGIDLLFYAFRAWTKDTYSDTHAQQGLAPEFPPM